MTVDLNTPGVAKILKRFLRDRAAASALGEKIEKATGVRVWQIPLSPGETLDSGACKAHEHEMRDVFALYQKQARAFLEKKIPGVTLVLGGEAYAALARGIAEELLAAHYTGFLHASRTRKG